MTNQDLRREVAARHLHEARCAGCVNGRYSGEHKKPLPTHDFEAADALIAELDEAVAR
jgi:hypothetical protein